MRVTGPAVRRRNHAWLQMRSLERRATRLARRQELEDDTSDDVDTSGDDADTSGDESEDSLDGVDSSDDESDAEPTQSTRPPLATLSAGLRAGSGGRLLPTARSDVATGVTLGAAEPGEKEDGNKEDVASESDSEESADESTAPPSNTTRPAAGGPPPGVTSSATTSAISSSSSSGSDGPGFAAPPALLPGSGTTELSPGPSGGSSSSVDELITTLTGTSLTASATSAPSPSVPITGSIQDGQDMPPNRQAYEPEGGATMGIESKSKLNSGAIAGIVLGVLAFLLLLAGAALFWRKRRRDKGLPFFPAAFIRLRDNDDSRPSSVSGPFPAKANSQNLVKTNTQIMDDLMKAAYAANNGTNEMEGVYAPAVPKLPPQLPAQQHDDEAGVFLDEKAYVALAGPPTPGSPKKPVMRWLDEVKTPTMPNGPEIPPTPAMPPSTRGSRVMPSGGRVPEPPKPAYYGRQTMTTDTTNTSVRWYG